MHLFLCVLGRLAAGTKSNSNKNSSGKAGHREMVFFK